MRLWRWVRPLALASLVALIALPAYRFSAYRGMLEARGQADHRLNLLASAVDSIIMRLEHIPVAVDLNPDVTRLMTATGAEAGPLAMRVNRYLATLKREVGALAVYVLDESGTVLASSNAGGPDSLVGQNLSYRTYFRWALGGLVGRQFAEGGNGGEPGYFVARPIRDDGMIVGVAAVKIGLGELNEALAKLDSPALIADHSGVVIMSSVERWLYSALEPLPEPARAEAAASRRYGGREIRPFPARIDVRASPEGETVSLLSPVTSQAGPTQHESREHMVLVRPLERTGWWLVQFADLQAVHQQAREHALLAATASGLLLMLLVFLAQRRRLLRQRLENQAMLERANAELEQTVAIRTQDLSAANARLREEMAEREQAQRTLREAQDELVQAAKLAVLGQLATGITHELTQPLGAIRTLAGNAAEFIRRGATDKADQNLAIVNRLADQMGAMVAQLKTFARKSPARPADVKLAAAVRNALLLVEHKLQKGAVTVQLEVPQTAQVRCDPVRLEQVLVNLCANAADAMAGHPGSRLTISVEGDAHWPRALRVADNGPGFSEGVLARLFEPFFTTKPPGEGLGLGLAISRDIAREFGGELSAANAPAGGACFRIDLPQGPAGDCTQYE